MIAYEGYLTQDKLGKILDSLPEFKILGREVRVGSTRKRWDFVVEHISSGEIIAIEFDGDKHYSDSITQLSDVIKDSIASENNINVVRVPYWLQLDNYTFNHLFGFGPSTDICNSFKHGFISTKVFPASFNKIGMNRFFDEVRCLDNDIKREIILSLLDRSDKYGFSFVWDNHHLEYMVHTMMSRMSISEDDAFYETLRNRESVLEDFFGCV